MILRGFEKRPPRRALARGALAVLLTLYLFNIYPKVSFGVDVEVENIFDFSVPVGIVETGVVRSLIGELTEEDFSHMAEQMRPAFTNFYNDQYIDDDWISVAPYAQGYNTNSVFVTAGDGLENGTNLIFNTFGTSYSDGAIQAAAAPDTNVLFQSQDVLWLGIPDIEDQMLLVAEGYDVPFPTAFEEADVQLRGLRPDNQFFLNDITPDILATFDGGLLDSIAEEIDEESILAWFPSAWEEVKTKLALILHNHRYVMRNIIGPLSCFLYVFMCFRWWLRRIFFVFEVFSGVPSGRTEPWSNDSEMKV